MQQCVGFFLVASTISLMKKLFLLSASVFPIALSAQAFMQAYQSRGDQTNLNIYLTEFAGIGVKTVGSTDNTSTFNWLKQK